MGLMYKQCDIFTSGCDILVNPVNCVGVMGKGLALQFKQRYPVMFEWYKQQCNLGRVSVNSTPLVYYSMFPWVCLFPTKVHWRDRSKLEWIDTGLDKFRAVLLNYPSLSVCLPPLGCGLGGLGWKDVRALIDRHLGSLPNDIIVTRTY